MPVPMYACGILQIQWWKICTCINYLPSCQHRLDSEKWNMRIVD